MSQPTDSFPFSLFLGYSIRRHVTEGCPARLSGSRAQQIGTERDPDRFQSAVSLFLPEHIRQKAIDKKQFQIYLAIQSPQWRPSVEKKFQIYFREKDQPRIAIVCPTNYRG